MRALSLRRPAHSAPTRPPVADRPPTPEPERCPNCGAHAPRAYCPECGQAQRQYHRSLRALAGDLLDAFAGWDDKIPATFRLLVTRPGGLTQEFLAGRRMRYLPPLRLYLTTSLLLLVSLRLAVPGGREVVRVRGGDAERVATDVQIVVPGLSFGISAEDVSAPAADDRSLGARLQRGLRARWQELQALPPEVAAGALRTSFLSYLGTTLFLMVPVFALLCMGLWRRARLFYVEHLVFALHSHAQAMLAIALARFAPGWLALAPAAWAAAYQWRAVRRLYGAAGESRARTAAKGVLLALAYGVTLLVGLLATLFVALLVRG